MDSAVKCETKTVNVATASSVGNAQLRPKILILEDQRLVAEFFAVHCAELGFEVLPWCGSCREGWTAIRTHLPDLLLLDISLPDGDGLELAKRVQQEFAQIKILAISAHRDPWTMLQVQRLCLNGFVDKNEQSMDILTAAIRAVLAGQIYYTPIVGKSSASIRKDPKAFNRVLSEYETKILSIIGESKNDCEIAEILGIAPATVQSRRRDIMTKLDIHATPKLINYAIVNGLTRAEQLGRPNIV
jgi:DNA-binding NarL/FixJ family response regulator